MKHRTVYADPAYYAGWPANHGAWQWRDEFLVGFLRGTWGRKSMHNCIEPFVKLLARSRDGGETWTLETPNVDFDCLDPLRIVPPPLDLRRVAVRACGVYDHGGDFCHPAGGFYASNDYGHSWHGPWPFNGIEIEEVEHNTSRTCVLDDLIFLSVAERDHWGTDRIVVARSTGGPKLERVADLLVKGRAVMPAVVRAGDRIVLVARRRGGWRRDCWIDCFVSDDGAATWRYTSMVAPTGSHNGNPPALIALGDESLLCAFANRDLGAMQYAVSDDRGEHWSSPRTFRLGVNDIGYPRLFMRSDGVPVCVYYFADAERPQQFIAATALEGI